MPVVPERAIRRLTSVADQVVMAANDDVDARRDRGEAALHEAIARAHDDRAAMARRIGAFQDAKEAAHQATVARARAERALGRT